MSLHSCTYIEQTNTIFIIPQRVQVLCCWFYDSFDFHIFLLNSLWSVYLSVCSCSPMKLHKPKQLSSLLMKGAFFTLVQKWCICVWKMHNMPLFVLNTEISSLLFNCLFKKNCIWQLCILKHTWNLNVDIYVFCQLSNNLTDVS